MTAKSIERIVDTWVERVVAREAAFEDLDVWLDKLLAGTAHAEKSLSHIFSVGDAEQKLVASTIVLTLIQQGAPTGAELKAAAEETVCDALRGHAYWQAHACNLLLRSGVTDAVAATLRELLKSDEAVVAAQSAAILCSNESDRALAVPTLREALGSEERFVAGFAAATLFRFGIESAAPVRTLVRLLPCGDAEETAQILHELRGAQINSPALVECLVWLLKKPNSAATVQRTAVDLLGTVVSDSPAIRDAIAGTLGSSEWRVVESAIVALENRADLTSDFATAFVAMLTHEDPSIQSAGIMGLQKLGHEARHVTDALIAHLKTATNVAFGMSLAGAIGAIGDFAIPGLIALVRENDARTLVPATLAFKNMGAVAAAALTRVVIEEEEPNARAALFAALLAMGAHARDCLGDVSDLFAELLPDDDAGAIQVLQYVANAGTAAAPLAPSIIAMLVSGRRSPGCLAAAEFAINRMGSEAVAVLIRAANCAPASERARLVRVLRGVPVDAKRFEDFITYADDACLEHIVNVALLLGKNRRMLHDEIQTALERLQQQGGITPNIGLSARLLQNRARKFEQVFGISLTEGKKGPRGIMISSVAWPILDMMEEYITFRRAQKTSLTAPTT